MMILPHDQPPREALPLRRNVIAPLASPVDGRDGTDNAAGLRPGHRGLGHQDRVRQVADGSVAGTAAPGTRAPGCVLRHPMPYGDLERQCVQRFAR
jgi:hypothetical protein